jgi:hypothetical protein
MIGSVMESAPADRKMAMKDLIAGGHPLVLMSGEYRSRCHPSR